MDAFDILNGISDAIAVVSLESLRVVYVNLAWRDFAQHMAMDPDTAVGEPYFSLCPPHIDTSALKTHIETLQRGETTSFSFVCSSHTQDHGLRWMRLQGRCHDTHIVITHADHTHQALEELLLNQSLQTVFDAVILIDDHGVVLEANAMVEPLFGYTREEFIGREISCITPEPEANAHERYLSRYLDGGEPRVSGQVRELVARHRDGTCFPVEINVSEARLAGGRRLFMGVIRDVRKRKAAERRLQLAQQLNDTVVSSLAEGVAIYDNGGRMLSCNASVQRILGLSRTELIGRSPEDRGWRPILLDGSTLDEYPLERTLRTGEPCHGAIFGLRTTSGMRWLSTNTQPIYLHDGSRTGPPDQVLLSFSDISPFIESQRKLEFSEERFRTLIEHSADGVLVIDSERNVLFHSQGARVLLGEALRVGSLIEDLVPEHQRSALLEWLQLTTQRSTTPNLRCQLHSGDDTPRFVQIAASNLLGESLIEGILLSLRDVTETVRQAEELAALESYSQEAHRLESLGMLASNVAHDFANLIMVIRANNSLAGRRSVSITQRFRAIGNVEGACERASSLCRQLLDYAGRGEHDPEPVQLASLVREIGQLLEASIPAWIELEIKIGSEPLMILGDPGQLQQVVMNLVLNARDAIEQRCSPSGGRIALGVLVVRPTQAQLVTAVGSRLEPGAPCVEFSVQDNGVGISEEAREHLFDPFFTTRPNGRGLGLASVLGLVKQHGGALRVESEVGRGSTFSAFFPLFEDAVLSQLAGPDDAEDVWPSRRVLLVEDDPELGRATQLLLESLDHQVEIVDTASRAMERLMDDGAHFDLILLDFQLPDMSGDELLAALRERGIPEMPPVILCTGVRTSLQDFDDPAVRGVLRKPYSIRSLSQLIEGALGER